MMTINNNNLVVEDDILEAVHSMENEKESASPPEYYSDDSADSGDVRNRFVPVNKHLQLRNGRHYEASNNSLSTMVTSITADQSVSNC